jgi:hypothetical protein
MFWRRRKPTDADAATIRDLLEAVIRHYEAVAAGIAPWPGEDYEAEVTRLITLAKPIACGGGPPGGGHDERHPGPRPGR